MTIAASLTENSAITANIIQQLSYQTNLTENTSVTSRIVQNLKIATGLTENTSITSQIVQNLKIATGLTENGAITAVISNTIALSVGLSETATVSSSRMTKTIGLPSALTENSTIGASIIKHLALISGLTENSSITSRIIQSLMLSSHLTETSLITSRPTIIKYFQAALSDASQILSYIVYIRVLAVSAISALSNVVCNKLVNLTLLFLDPFTPLNSSSTGNFELVPMSFNVEPDLDWNISPRIINTSPTPDAIVPRDTLISFDIENVPGEDIIAYALAETSSGKPSVSGLDNFVITPNPNIPKGFTCTGNLPAEFIDGSINIVVRATTVDHGISILVGTWQYRIF